MKNLFYLLSICFLFSCASSKKLNRLSIGMSQFQVLKILGEPISKSSPGDGIEYLNYRLSETGAEAYNGISYPYYVMLVDDKVTEYGRLGEFAPYDNGNMPNEQRALTKTEQMEKELLVLKRLLDDNIITEEEFTIKKKEVISRY